MASPYTYEQVSAEILAYVKKWIPDERTGILGGLNEAVWDGSETTKRVTCVVSWKLGARG